MTAYTLYPAIDLHQGRVVRLRQGDLARRRQYSADPAETAARWRAAGADWLHVVNLDGAFGLEDEANRRALRAILQTGARVQFGGGLRSLEAIAALLNLGVRRVVLGTAAVENPDLVKQALQRFGPQAIAVALDAHDGRIRTRGWQQESDLSPLALGKALACAGLRTVIYTDIARDGMESGADLDGARELARAAGLRVILSGGVASLDDLRRIRAAGLAGAIVGRALYEGRFTLQEALAC